MKAYERTLIQLYLTNKCNMDKIYKLERIKDIDRQDRRCQKQILYLQINNTKINIMVMH